MIQHNPEIEVIIANATDLAKKYNHEYVTCLLYTSDAADE